MKQWSLKCFEIMLILHKAISSVVRSVNDRVSFYIYALSDRSSRTLMRSNLDIIQIVFIQFNKKIYPGSDDLFL